MDLRSTLLVIGGSACSFKLLNTIVRLLPTPVQASKKAWRWRNISTSLAHSSLTGAWAVLCFYLQPQTVEDLISSHSVFSHSLVAVSTGETLTLTHTKDQQTDYFILPLGPRSTLNLTTLTMETEKGTQPSPPAFAFISLKSGSMRFMMFCAACTCVYLMHAFIQLSPLGYFINDLLDLAVNQSFKQSWELLFHHSVVISCFSVAVTTRLYLGFAVVSLLVEINSVFLHIRQLLLLSGQRNRPGTEVTAPRPSVAYVTTSWLNMGT
ncbi:TLC domain-containing protein 2-like [Seriola aureovittata]|uniref:TLC domain-containing protein 2-like n=1 Tax=Seriola aureovittata TaxID=2871759 RepID=UPI0024BE50C3|nr:TLC domain-containing protein 2-like [Seriola aureovittata]